MLNRKASIEIKRESENTFIVKIKDLGIAIKKNGRAHTIFSPSLKVLGYCSKGLNGALADFEENLKLFFSVHLKDDSIGEALNDLQWKNKSILTTPSFDADTDSVLEPKDYELAIAA